MGNIAARAGANIGNMLAQQGGTGQLKDWMSVASSAASTAHQQQENQLTAWKMQGLKELGQIYATNDPDTANKIASSSKWAALIPEQIEKNVAIANGLRDAEQKDYAMTKNLALDTAKMFPFLMLKPTPEEFDRLAGMALTGVRRPDIAARASAMQSGMKEALYGGTEDILDPDKRAAQVQANIRALALYSGMGANELAYAFGHPPAQIIEKDGQVTTVGSPFLGGPMSTGSGGPGTMTAAGRPDYRPGVVEERPLPPNIDREPGSPTRTTAAAGEPVPIYQPPTVVDDSPAKLSTTTDPRALSPTWGDRGVYNKPVQDAQDAYKAETPAVHAARKLMNDLDHMERSLDSAQRSGITAPGWWNENRVYYVNALNTLLHMTGKEGVNVDQVRDMDDFVKRAALASFDVDVAHFGASRQAFQTIQASFRTMPTLNQSYQGAKLILDGWRENLKYDLDKRDFKDRYFEQNKNYYMADEKFNEKFPLSAYRKRTEDIWGLGPEGYGKDMDRLKWAHETGRLSEPEYMRLAEKILRGENAVRTRPRL